jgi:hypothetical protein
MTEEDLPFEYRKIDQKQQKQKKTSSDYWKTQNEKRLNVGISRSLIGQLRGIRNYTGFTNDDQTVEYLLEIEESVRKQNLIKKVRVCEKCGVPIDIKLDSYKGITHQHIDTKSNCFGCIVTKYRIKTKIEVLPGTKEAKTEQTETIQDKVEEIETTKKEEKKKGFGDMTEEEMDELRNRDREEFDRILNEEMELNREKYGLYNRTI